MEFNQKLLKDIGRDKEVLESLPYANVGNTWDASFQNPIGPAGFFTALTHIVPRGKQLKILFLRIWTQEPTGARFSIVQTNPSVAGATGTVEAFPVVGSVPPFTAGLSAVRDYPFLTAAGETVLHGRLEQPIHVLEGSVDFRVLGPTPIPAAGSRYSISWWGVQENLEAQEA